MITNFKEYSVPIVVTAIGLALVAVLANPTDNSDELREIEISKFSQSNSDSIAQLESKFEEMSTSLSDQTAALESKINALTSRVENESVTINKAMGRISQRIAKQSDQTANLEQSIVEMGSTSSRLINHTQTLDSAAVQQLRRHKKLQQSLKEQELELKRLLELNSKLGEIFSSF